MNQTVVWRLEFNSFFKETVSFKPYKYFLQKSHFLNCYNSSSLNHTSKKRSIFAKFGMANLTACARLTATNLCHHKKVLFGFELVVKNSIGNQQIRKYSIRNFFCTDLRRLKTLTFCFFGNANNFRVLAFKPLVPQK